MMRWRAPPDTALPPVGKGSRIVWLDLLRFLAILEIVGFHWVRTCQENGSFGLVWSRAYMNVGIGFGQLHYVLIDHSGLSISALVNNLIGVTFSDGWAAVNVFVLLSGLANALSYRPYRPGFSAGNWLFHRFRKILLPFFAIAIPMILAAELVKHLGAGSTGILGKFAARLADKNLPDPLAVELAKNLLLVDPRRPFWTTDFFSPAWWFIPPILVGYLFFPAIYRGVERIGSKVMLFAALPVSIVGYWLSDRGLLWEHGFYFVVLQELFSFTLGIAIGRFLAVPAGGERVERLLRSWVSIPAGVLLFVLGNIANWFEVLHPFYSPVLTAGLTLLLARLAIWLAQWRQVLALTRKLEPYHLYLLHQSFAIPVVLTVAALFGDRSRSLGFSLGFVGFLLTACLVTGAFDRGWRWLTALFDDTRPAAPAYGLRR
jgi:hypothetical protein